MTLGSPFIRNFQGGGYIEGYPGVSEDYDTPANFDIFMNWMEGWDYSNLDSNPGEFLGNMLQYVFGLQNPDLWIEDFDNFDEGKLYHLFTAFKDNIKEGETEAGLGAAVAYKKIRQLSVKGTDVGFGAAGRTLLEALRTISAKKSGRREGTQIAYESGVFQEQEDWVDEFMQQISDISDFGAQFCDFGQLWYNVATGCIDPADVGDASGDPEYENWQDWLEEGCPIDQNFCNSLSSTPIEGGIGDKVFVPDDGEGGGCQCIDSETGEVYEPENDCWDPNYAAENPEECADDEEDEEEEEEEDEGDEETCEDEGLVTCGDGSCAESEEACEEDDEDEYGDDDGEFVTDCTDQPLGTPCIDSEHACDGFGNCAGVNDSNMFACEDGTIVNFENECPENLSCEDQINMVTDPDTGECVEYDPETTVLGCTDPDAANYDPEAEVDDGSCNDITDVPSEDWGCMDPSYDNYDPEALFDDGSCTNIGDDPAEGYCQDECASNFQMMGDCIYPEEPLPGCGGEPPSGDCPSGQEQCPEGSLTPCAPIGMCMEAGGFGGTYACEDGTTVQNLDECPENQLSYCDDENACNTDEEGPCLYPEEGEDCFGIATGGGQGFGDIVPDEDMFGEGLI